MKSKIRLFLLVACATGSALFADSISVAGGSVTYSGAEAASLPGGDVILVFTNTQEIGTFSLPRMAKARVLAVAGGGAGGAMSYQDESGGMGAAGGGGAGGVSDAALYLKPGDYTVNVGAGGQRVQTIVQSWVGANGENTEVAYGDERIVLSRGGGGGGTAKMNGRGEDGGSGGGGSWYGSFTRGGTATDGQGWSGGTSADTFNGAGGGGAAIDFAAGIGKPDGTAGAGRELDVTGEAVVYGQGGRGGVRNDNTYEPQDGAGYGFGGDGAGESGQGGAGGNGIVVVRISKLFDYTRVPLPTGIPSPTWTNHTTYVAFNPAIAAEPLKSAIAYVDGVTMTNTSVVVTNTVTGASVTNGLGRFHFVIGLKDEYVWNDGTPDGSSRPMVTYWRVKPQNTIEEASIETTKTVTWSEGTDAKIGITIHATPEKVARDPRVLLLGSGCGAHGFSSSVVNAALNAATEKGDIDCFLFKANNSKTSVAPAFSVSLKKGEKRQSNQAVTIGTQNLESTTAQHGTLYEFYAQLSTIIDEINAGTRRDYDYIIFSFDRGLVGTAFVGTHDDEAKVIEYMHKFYDKDAVIWMVDHESGADEKLPDGITQWPWYPCPIAYVSGPSYNYWRTLDYYVYNWGNSAQSSSPYGYAAYKAMLGLFDQHKYETLTESDYAADRSSTIDVARMQRLSGAPIVNQVVYDNAAEVADMIASVVKQPPAIVQMRDTVYADAGLEVLPEGTQGKWTTNAVLQGWVDLTPDQFVIGESGVRLKLEGIKDPVDVNLSIKVRDGGLFRTSIHATLNPKTGLWEKDPNNGPVRVYIAEDEDGNGVMVEDWAATAVAWSFPSYNVTCKIVQGDGTPFPEGSEEGNGCGEMVINGFITNSVQVAAGNSPEVVFRGKGGYVLSYLEVDGIVIENFDANLYNWIFNEVSADHEIRVGFKQVFTTPYPTTGPVVHEYDGTGYHPTVTMPTFIDGYSYEWEPVYCMESNGVYTAENGNEVSAYSAESGQTNVVYDANGNVTSTNVYVRIKIYQPGYEDGAVIDYWTGVNTVTILPRPITVKFDDYVQTSYNNAKTKDYTWQRVEGILVEGDEIANDPGQCPNRPTTAGGTPGDIYNMNAMYVITPDGSEGGYTRNYTVTVLPGKYYYPNRDLVAKALNVEKVYDGKSYSNVVEVVFPNDAKSSTGDYGDWTYYNNDGTTASYSFRRRNTKRRERTRTKNELLFWFSEDNGETYVSKTTPSTRTRKDVGVSTNCYIVTYFTGNEKETQTRSQSGSNWSDNDSSITSTYTTITNITYIPYTNVAYVTILPRPVTVTAHDAAKKYDGNALTQPDYTITPPTDVTGFVEGEGYKTDYPRMTADSSITLPGRKQNVIDTVNLQSQLKSNTKASNYNFTFIDGLLVVSNNLLKATVGPREKIYDGTPLPPLQFIITDEDGSPVPVSNCIITYGKGLDGSPVTHIDPLTDVDYVKIPYTVSAVGYGNVVSGETYMRVTPRTVTLQADDAEKFYDGDDLTYNGFHVVPGSGDNYGFVQGEGVASVLMTPDSAIKNPGTHPNRIDVTDTRNWEFVGNTKSQNYTFVVIPGELKVKPWLKRSLWITDHEPYVKDWVYLAFEPHIVADDEMKQGWVTDMAENHLFAVKYGLTRAKCDECVATEAELSDVHEIKENKIWIRVELAKLRDANAGLGENFDPSVGFWRINVRPKNVPDAPERMAQMSSADPTVEPTLDDVVDQDEEVDSLNTFGILKIESVTADTLVAVPWTWYSQTQAAAEDIPVKKFVKTTNLTNGDCIYATTDGGVSYKAWVLQNDEWLPANIVEVDKNSFGRMTMSADEEDEPGCFENATRVARGNGLWICRHRPVDENGKAIPFWIYGQSVTTDVITPIPGPAEGQKVCSTIVGNPYAREVNLNELEFIGNIDEQNDKIWFYSADGKKQFVTYYPGRGWRMAVEELINGIPRNRYVYNIVIPAGMAFWYDRRGSGDLQIRWSRKDELK